MTLTQEIEQAKQQIAMAENQYDNAIDPAFQAVAWKRLDAERTWLDALIGIAKKEARVG